MALAGERNANGSIQIDGRWIGQFIEEARLADGDVRLGRRSVRKRIWEAEDAAVPGVRHPERRTRIDGESGRMVQASVRRFLWIAAWVVNCGAGKVGLPHHNVRLVAGLY